MREHAFGVAQGVFFQELHIGEGNRHRMQVEIAVAVGQAREIGQGIAEVTQGHETRIAFAKEPWFEVLPAVAGMAALVVMPDPEGSFRAEFGVDEAEVGDGVGHACIFFPVEVFIAADRGKVSVHQLLGDGAAGDEGLIAGGDEAGQGLHAGRVDQHSFADEYVVGGADASAGKLVRQAVSQQFEGLSREVASEQFADDEGAVGVAAIEAVGFQPAYPPAAVPEEDRQPGDDHQDGGNDPYALIILHGQQRVIDQYWSSREGCRRLPGNVAPAGGSRWRKAMLRRTRCARRWRSAPGRRRPGRQPAARAHSRSWFCLSASG